MSEKLGQQTTAFEELQVCTKPFAWIRQWIKITTVSVGKYIFSKKKHDACRTMDISTRKYYTWIHRQHTHFCQFGPLLSIWHPPLRGFYSGGVEMQQAWVWVVARAASFTERESSLLLQPDAEAVPGQGCTAEHQNKGALRQAQGGMWPTTILPNWGSD